MHLYQTISTKFKLGGISSSKWLLRFLHFFTTSWYVHGMHLSSFTYAYLKYLNYSQSCYVLRQLYSLSQTIYLFSTSLHDMYVHQAFSRIHADRAMARMGVGLQIAGKGTVFNVSLPVSGMTYTLVRFLGGVSWLNLNGRDRRPRVGIIKLSVVASV